MAEVQDKYSYTVYLIGGERVGIEAANYKISQPDNQLFFEGVEEKEYGQWVFFLSGIAAIHKTALKEIPLVAPIVVPQRVLG